MVTCMYGAPHPGDAVVVRNKVGRSVGALCPTHYQQHSSTLLKNGYHFRTQEELEARGEHKEFYEDGRETSPELDSQFDETRPHQHNDDSSDSPPGLGPTPVVAGGDRSLSESFDSDTSPFDPIEGRLIPTTRTPPTETDMEERRLDTRPTARGDSHEGSRGLKTVDVPALAWWQGAGELELTIEQTNLLRAPFRSDLIQKNYEGEWFVPWVHIWKRLLDVFDPDIPSLIPLCEPQIGTDHVLVHYCMLVRGQFAGEAWGYCERKGNNKKMDIGNCIESATSEAIRRIGKRNGVGLQLWELSTIRELEGGRKRG